MKRLLTVGFAALAATALLGADIADARRLGGGRNLGAQRQSVQPPAATPAPTAPAGAASNPVMPAQPAAAAASRAAPGMAAAGAGMGRWMGPVAGLAAGLGLAWLAHSLGFSEALMSALLVMLAVVAGFALLRFVMARRAPTRAPLPYAGAGGGLAGRAGGYETQVPPSTASRDFEPVPGGARAAEPVRGRFPPGFDPAPFLKQARSQFTRLQAAYDSGDRATLADVMTPELYAEISQELDERKGHVPTEVVALNPEIVDVSTEGDQHWASVRFRGLLREDGSPLPKPLDELWNLVKPADGSSGWLLAGIRQIDDAPVGHA